MSMLDKAHEIIQNKDVDSNLTELYSEIAQKMIHKYKSKGLTVKQYQTNLKDELNSLDVNMDNIIQDLLDIYHNNVSNDISIDIYDYLKYIPYNQKVLKVWALLEDAVNSTTSKSYKGLFYRMLYKTLCAYINLTYKNATSKQN